MDELGGGRYRLRWRQRERQDNGDIKRVQRTTTAFSMDEARRLTLEIEAALKAQGWWRANAPSGARPADGNLEQEALRWMQRRRAVKWTSENTWKNVAGCLARWFSAMRKVLKLSKSEVIPVAALNRECFERCVGVLRSRSAKGAGTAYHTASRALELWRFLVDLGEWDLSSPPQLADELLPPTPVYAAPQDSPCWADTDHCLNRIRLPTPLRMATLMRYTGLRISQVAAIRREHLDLHRGTLFVAKSKSRREAALAREVPVSPHLLADLRAWLSAHGDGPLFPGPNPDLPMPSPRNQTRYVTEAWKAATAARQVKQGVWNPPNRQQARPDHAFRAALQAELMNAGVQEALIDRLVGHQPRTTRGQHYVSASMPRLVEAVAAIPRVVWTPEALQTLQAGVRRPKRQPE